MGIIQKFLGPTSKYNKSLPYTYLAKVPIIEGMKNCSPTILQIQYAD